MQLLGKPKKEQASSSKPGSFSNHQGKLSIAEHTEDNHEKMSETSVLEFEKG